jgi:predicted RNA-binding Zn-ribbon protein involved in translation (DUF1610 family)
MTKPNPLRDELMKVLYDNADESHTPWFSDKLWDDIIAAVEREYQKRADHSTGKHIKSITLPADFGSAGKGGVSFPCPCCGTITIVNLNIAKGYSPPKP